MHECYYVHDNSLHNNRFVIFSGEGTNVPSIPITYLMYSFLCQNETKIIEGGKLLLIKVVKAKIG